MGGHYTQMFALSEKTTNALGNKKVCFYNNYLNFKSNEKNFTIIRSHCVRL